MAELDVFERRLAPPSSAWRTTSGGGGRRRRGPPGGPRSTRATGRPSFAGAWSRSRAWPGSCSCWRALLAALVGGTLLVGSQPQRRLPAVVPPVGQVFACPPGSTPDEPGPVDQARPPEADMAWHRHGIRPPGRQAGGRRERRRRRRDVDVRRVHEHLDADASEPGAAELRLGPARLRHRLRRDDPGLRPDPRPGRCGPTTSRPTPGPRRGLRRPMPWSPSAYDPVSGLVVAAGRFDRNEADVDLRGRDRHVDPDPPGERAVAAAAGCSPTTPPSTGSSRTSDGSTGEPETWLFDIRTGTWSRSGAETPASCGGWGRDRPSSTTRRRSGRWSRQLGIGRLRRDRGPLGDPGRRRTRSWRPTATSMVYDPVNGRLVGPGPYDNADGVHLGRAAVFAFDPGTREWTVLLEPGEGQPANTPTTMPAPTSARTPTPSGGAEETDPTSPVPTASPTSSP